MNVRDLPRIRLQETGTTYLLAHRTVIIHDLHEDRRHKVSFSLLFEDTIELYVAVQLSGVSLTLSSERSV